MLIKPFPDSAGAPAPIGSSVSATKLEDQPDLRTTYASPSLIVLNLLSPPCHHSSAFKKLDADTVTFRLSVPREFQTMQQHANPDNRMCLIFSVPHASTILLHEPFCSMTPGCPSLARCLLSAKAILESIYTLWSESFRRCSSCTGFNDAFALAGSSFEIGLLAPFVNFTWAVAGRESPCPLPLTAGADAAPSGTLVRDLAIRQAKNNLMGQEQLKSDVNTILAALRAYKSPLGGTPLLSLSSTPLSLPPQTRPPNPCNTSSTTPRDASLSTTSSTSASGSGPEGLRRSASPSRNARLRRLRSRVALLRRVRRRWVLG